MYKRSLKTTLFLYLAYAWLVSSLLSAVILLAEYSPGTQKAVQRFGIGALILDCVLWGLLFTIAGSLSLLNMHYLIRKSFFLSLGSFILLPVIALITVLLISRTTELTAATDVAIMFLVTQVFFFFRFRNCVKQKTILSVD